MSQFVAAIALGAFAIGLLISASTTQAEVVLTAVETGGDVVISGGGTLNLDAWKFNGNGNDTSIMNPEDGILIVGPDDTLIEFYAIKDVNDFMDADFGADIDSSTPIGSGDMFGWRQFDQLDVPFGYVSGEPLSGSATYSDTTFDELGMEVGTYVWSWGSDETADSFTLIVGEAEAEVILQVDVSDPTAVVFTPTAAFADNSFSGVDPFDGISLLSFFSGNTTNIDVDLDSGAINVFDSSAGTSRKPLDGIYIQTAAGGFTLQNINFWGNSATWDPDSMFFLNTATALTGLASHDLSGVNGFPTLGTIGNIVAGQPDLNQVIGRWEVVAPVILEVDVSDPSAVVLTSTPAFAENTVLNADSTEGILLSGFFSGNTGTGDELEDSGAINVFDSTAGTARQPLDQIFVGDMGLATTLDLNIYGVQGGGFLMSFVDTDDALRGFLEGDLSVGGITGLPTPGASGDVFAGGLAGANIIGQWEVVPEPSAALTMVASLATLGAIARSRRAESRTA